MLRFFGFGNKVEFHDAMVTLCNEYKDALKMAMDQRNYFKAELEEVSGRLARLRSENKLLQKVCDELRAELDRFHVMMPMMSDRGPTITDE